MFPAGRGKPLLLGAALAIAAPAAAHDDSSRAETVERYLASRGLDSLEFESITDRLADVSESERRALVNRAAELLSDLLESETDPTLQREWSERAKELLRQADGPAASELEIRLLRAAYQRAERAAERWRLRAATDTEVAAAQRTLTDSAARLERIARQTDQRAVTYEKRLTIAVGDERDRLREELAGLRSTRSQARYLAGWCRLYLAQMTGRADDARDALLNFAWILGSPESAEPDLDSVNTDSLQLDHVARAAIGTATAYAVLGNANAADDWLQTVSLHGGPDMVDVVEGWRLVIDAQLGRWGALSAAMRAEPDPTAARLIAVATVEALRGGTHAVSAAREALENALAALIDLGDSASVVELSRLYGTLPVPGRGFLARYAEGVGLYLDAESRFRISGNPSDQPAPPGVHRTNFGTAARALSEALQANDAERFSGAVSETHAILGAALFYAADSASDLARSREHLDAAAIGLPDPQRRAGALWLAVRSARLEAEQTDGEGRDEASRVADELAARFLREFPQHPLAGAILYEMAMRDGLDPQRKAELLARIPATSDAYAAARDQIARALYRVFRSVGSESRTPAALRYIDAAEPLLTSDLEAATTNEQAADRALARARRLLDALLSMTPPDAVRARGVLERVASLPGANEPGARMELSYRTAQIALISGDTEAADAAIAQLESLAENDPRAGDYAVALRRFVFRQAVDKHQSVRTAQASSEVIADAARRVADAGRALIRGTPDLNDPAMYTAASYLAEALDDLALYTTDRGALAEALELRLASLEIRPADAELLRRVAMGAELLDRNDVARDAWNRRLALLPVGNDEWFETRYRQLRHLATVDPVSAREVIRRQHRVLYPDFGPPPWGPMLRELDESLGDEP